MKYISAIFIVCQINILLLSYTDCAIQQSDNDDDSFNSDELIASDDYLSTLKLPTILIATLFRNKAHTLPHFLSYLERLDYPKDRISLWLVSKAKFVEKID